jgi:lipopolysaccharide biosynthesis regulator YciM
MDDNGMIIPDEIEMLRKAQAGLKTKYASICMIKKEIKNDETRMAVEEILNVICECMEKISEIIKSLQTSFNDKVLKG